MSAEAPILAFRGGDSVALEEAVRTAVDDLVGDGDRSLIVEELRKSDWEDDNGDHDITPLANAAQTPPFLTESRVVVARETGSFSKADDLRPLLEYLEAPLETTTVVFVWERLPQSSKKFPPFPRALNKAIKDGGGVSVDTAPGYQSSPWIDEQVKDAAVTLSGPAKKLMTERFGEDASRIVGVLRTLEGAFGPGAKVDDADLGPFLGEAGGVAPWDLTDAIDRGDIPGSIALATRMMQAGGRHPVQLLFMLHGHYRNMLALDGADVTGEDAAAELLGVKPYPAKKAMLQARRLGSESIAEAISLLAQADMDVKGAKGWPPELVIELLVARLAQGARRRR